MNAIVQQFPFVPRDPSLSNASLAPILPLVLIGSQRVATTALVDSGAAINVLPYSLGMQLGFDWLQETRSVELSGNLASVEARVVVLSAVVGGFPPVRLAFAWARTDAVSVILGQVNFFMEFDVCFFRSRAVFEVKPKTLGTGSGSMGRQTEDRLEKPAAGEGILLFGRCGGNAILGEVG
jgi:hypothetical protein